MTRIRVELLIQPNEKETALHMFSSTINEKICWRFLESDVVFSCAVRSLSSLSWTSIAAFDICFSSFSVTHIILYMR